MDAVRDHGTATGEQPDDGTGNRDEAPGGRGDVTLLEYIRDRRTAEYAGGGPDGAGNDTESRSVGALPRLVPGGPGEARDTGEIAAVVGPMEVVWAEQPANWTRVRPHLEKLVAHEDKHGMTLPGLCERIRDGRFKLWFLTPGKGRIDAVFLTAMYTQQNGRLILSLSWAGGQDVVDVADLISVFEAYARMQGCWAIEVIGRKGWERVLRPHGYGHFFTGLLKVLP